MQDHFEFPQKCKDHNKKFHCSQVTREEALNFRNRIYVTDEKRDQNDFLYKFIKSESIKGKKISGRRIVSNIYHIQLISGTVTVCQQMFQAVTGFGLRRCKKIIMKRIKNELLEKGDHMLMIPDKNLTEGQKLVKAKKEKLLNLEAGKLQEFTKAISGIEPEPIKNSNRRPVSTNPKLINKKKFYRCQKVVQEAIRDESLDEINFQPEPEIKNKVMLNLDRMEAVCRICLQTYRKKSMTNIFRRVFNQEYTIGGLLEFCLSVKIDPDDGLSKKICRSCYESAKISAKLKTDWLETQRLMEECNEKVQEFQVPETNEIFTYYSDVEEHEAQIVEQVVVYEEIEMSKSDYEKMEVDQDGNFCDQTEVAPSEHEFDENDSQSEDNEDVPTNATDKTLAYKGLRPRLCYL